jgi:hypothetical protein
MLASPIFAGVQVVKPCVPGSGIADEARCVLRSRGNDWRAEFYTGTPLDLFGARCVRALCVALLGWRMALLGWWAEYLAYTVGLLAERFAMAVTWERQWRLMADTDCWCTADFDPKEPLEIF